MTVIGGGAFVDASAPVAVKTSATLADWTGWSVQAHAPATRYARQEKR
jgi:hypothetical protein